MDSLSCFFNSHFSPRSRRNYNSPKNFSQISPVVQEHLKQVYLSLCCALLASAAGVYLHILCNVGGLLTFLVCIRCILWLQATPFHQEQKKVSLLMVTALLLGANIGPLAQLAIEFDSRIVISAFIGCSLSFGCIFGAATLARRIEYLCLAGLLSAGLSILLWLHLASFIFDTSMALLKFKLLVFVCYIELQTEDIIWKAQMGDLDYVNHAFTLFLHFIIVFVRLLNIRVKLGDEMEV